MALWNSYTGRLFSISILNAIEPIFLLQPQNHDRHPK
jgi:hypothetical protein